MTDVHAPDVRSKNMRAIRGRDTSPEVRLRKLLFRMGFRYRLHTSDLPSKPDIFLPKYKAAILVNGCFWHGHGCHLFKLPQTRKEFWSAKIAANVKRDKQNMLQLLRLGYRVLVVWECSLKGRKRLAEDQLASAVADWIRTTGNLGCIDGDGLHQASDPQRDYLICCGRFDAGSDLL